jgi:hypothetical protein
MLKMKVLKQIEQLKLLQQKIPPWRVKKFLNCLGEGISAKFCVGLVGGDDSESYIVCN